MGRRPRRHRGHVRASLLLVQAFVEQYREHPHGGRVVLFTSGQHRGPAPAEIPYAATKGALHQITATLADGGFRRFTP